MPQLGFRRCWNQKPVVGRGQLAFFPSSNLSSPGSPMDKFQFLSSFLKGCWTGACFLLAWCGPKWVNGWKSSFSGEKHHFLNALLLVSDFSILSQSPPLLEIQLGQGCGSANRLSRSQHQVCGLWAGQCVVAAACVYHVLYTHTHIYIVI